MKELILARHGESEYSARGAVNGDPSVAVGLTDAGREQARRLGELLAGDPIELCVTSEFQRVRETADLALAGRDVPRLVLDDLNDIRVGSFEGRPLAEYRRWAHENGPEEVPPGGDSRLQTLRRYVRAYRELLARPEALILVVAHGLPVRYVLNALEEISPVPFLEAVGYAEPHRVGVGDFEAAVGRLEEWCAAPAW